MLIVLPATEFKVMDSSWTLLKAAETDKGVDKSWN